MHVASALLTAHLINSRLTEHTRATADSLCILHPIHTGTQGRHRCDDEHWQGIHTRRDRCAGTRQDAGESVTQCAVHFVAVWLLRQRHRPSHRNLHQPAGSSRNFFCSMCLVQRLRHTHIRTHNLTQTTHLSSPFAPGRHAVCWGGGLPRRPDQVCPRRARG